MSMDQSSNSSSGRRKTNADFLYQEAGPASSKKKDKSRVSRRTYRNRTSEMYYESGSEFSAGQWNMQGPPRLYPTMSDSAVCGYTVPAAFDYPVNATAGYPMYPVYSTNVYPVGLEYTRRLSRNIRSKKHSKYCNDVDLSSGHNSNSNFTSLPPVNVGDENCNQKRRFSDPGLNNADESNDSSCTDSLSEECSISESLTEQVSELKAENQRLFSELENTKCELKTVKSEFAVLSNRVMCHEPISLAQMVKEIRDAAQIRENLLVSKVEALIEKCANNKNVNTFVSELDSLKKRVSQLEHQLEHLRIHSKVDSKMNGEASQEEIDKLIRKKNEILDKTPKSLTDSESIKKDISATSTIHSGVGGGGGDITNSDFQETGSDCNGNSLSTVSCESLSSSIGPGSLHSAYVTLCGPVTDL